MGKINDLRLDNHLILKGRWALKFEDLFENDSTFSENALAGNLELSDGTVYLDLNGHFGKLGSNNEIPRIYGYLSTGSYVILDNCFVAAFRFNAPGFTVEKFIADRAYIFDKKPCQLFTREKTFSATKVIFETDYLEEWYNIDLPEFVEGSDEFSVRYKNDFFDDNEFEILDGKFILSLKRDISAHYIYNSGTKVDIKPYISIRTRDYKTESLETFLEISNWILKFHDFIIQIYGKYLYLEARLEDETNRMRTEKLENGDYEFHYPLNTCRLIFPQLSERKSNMRYDSLRLSDIKDDYGSLIEMWFKNKDKLKYILDLYYQNGLQSLDIESTLVNKIKILEAYYDNFMNKEKEKITDKELKIENVKQKIKDNLNESQIEVSIKEEIINRLDKDGKPFVFLREKLTVILDKLPDELKSIFSRVDSNWNDCKDFIPKFATRLKDTRNFYTHGANEKRKLNRFKTNDEFFSADIVLDVVIYYFILKSLGLDDEKILNYPFLKNKIRDRSLN